MRIDLDGETPGFLPALFEIQPGAIEFIAPRVDDKGVIATPHRLAGEAGAQVLRDGGNAIDAAIAADAVLCVVYPHMTSVGGDLMAIVWPAGAASPVGLIGAGRSGELATIDAGPRRAATTRCRSEARSA